MSGSTLFHKFGEHTYFIGRTPFLWNMAEDTLTLSAALPIRNDFFFVSVYIFLADCITLQLTGVQNMQVFYAMASQFRESRHGFRTWATFSDNQFIFSNIDSFVFANFQEIESSKDRNRIFALVFFIETSLD